MQVHQEISMEKNVENNQWNVEESNDDTSCNSISNNEDSDNCVTSSSSSSFSSDLAEDASSSSSSSSLGPLFELSKIMAHLPMKRGLSKYYHGKSQSFTSLASVGNLEDLAKRGSSYNQRMKSCRSYGCGLDGRKYGPKATIGKKTSKLSFLSSLGTRSSVSAESCTRRNFNFH